MYRLGVLVGKRVPITQSVWSLCLDLLYPEVYGNLCYLSRSSCQLTKCPNCKLLLQEEVNIVEAPCALKTVCYNPNGITLDFLELANT